MADAALRKLYPATEPRLAEWLPVGEDHEIYFEDAGPADGLPVVFLHGGPGGGCKPSHRQFFDPARYRSVIFDQRGAGRSRPFGATAHNTVAATSHGSSKSGLGYAWTLVKATRGSPLKAAICGPEPPLPLAAARRVAAPDASE
jgi:proline iminopeptidase